MKTPQTATVYRTTSGLNVSTIAEWKHDEISTVLAKLHLLTPPGDADWVIDVIVENSKELCEILAVKDAVKIGRPNGSKNKAPRKASNGVVAAPVEVPQQPELVVHYETTGHTGMSCEPTALVSVTA